MHKFVFVLDDERDADDVSYIRNLDDLVDDLDIELEEADGPCYVTNVSFTGREISGVDVSELMHFLSREVAPGQHLLKTSVNSTEPRYEDWLQAAAEFPEANVFITQKTQPTREIAFITWPSVHHFNKS